MRSNKGITLVVLIITIIITLILIGVVVNITFDKNIIVKSKNIANYANEKTSNQAIQEDFMQSTWEELPGESIKSPTK